MKRFAVIGLAVLYLAAAVVPAYANTRQENNKNIADYVLDTLKLPWLLMGAISKQDHEKVKKELNYKGHQGLKKCLK